jgi:acyl-CoA thioesterase YciA
MSGVWLDARTLSTAASSSDRRLQVQSVDGADASFHHLWVSGIHEERHHRPAPTPGLHSVLLSLGLAGSNDLLLDLSQHFLVSICVMNSDPAIRITMLPRDTNSQGTIFGGVILSYIDMAGAIEAHRHTGMDRFVTVAMREVIFHAPVLVGDLVSFYSETLKIGTTSITVRVIVEAERYGQPGEVKRVTEAEVIYVAVDAKGNKTKISARKA